MYTVDAANALKFLSTNWQPIKTLTADDGSGQWEQDAYDKLTNEDGLEAITINKTAPVIDAVEGFQINNRFEVDYQPRRLNDEKAHNVCLTKDFWIAKYEVTQAQWKKVIGFNPSFFKRN